MIQIQPITLGLPPQEATKIIIRPLINSTTDLTCNTYYEVLSENGQTLANGNIPLSEEEYSSWGEDNTYLDNLILEKLGLKKL